MTRDPGSQVRIIAGRWRGRRIPVADVEGLRPTPDRIRETLFNWLAAECRGATVLDCFAGSGALGLEAASRGAKWVSLVEKNRLAWLGLGSQVRRLQAGNIEVIHDDVLTRVPRLQHRYDLVFVDPPYARPQLRNAILEALVAAERLADGAYIYLEWPKGETFDLPTAEFRWSRQKKAGQVEYAIAQWKASG